MSTCHDMLKFTAEKDKNNHLIITLARNDKTRELRAERNDHFLNKSSRQE